MTPRPLRLRPRAAADVAGIADACAASTGTDAARFIDALQAACAQLARTPDSGGDRHRHVVPELPAALRMLPVPGFAHILLFHMALPDAVEIIRVIDSTRGMESLLDPGALTSSGSPADAPREETVA